MNLTDFPFELHEMSCEWPAWSAIVAIEELSNLAQQIQIGQGQLLTLWGSDERLSGNGFSLHLVFIFWKQGTLYLRCNLPADNPTYPDLSSLFPVANRLQRALFDLLGIKASNSDDQRPWLRHGAWPEAIFPLRAEIKLDDQFVSQADDYTFVPVSGEGVHEIAVGPVHAGIIEPGHFRFSVVGERILRLEKRLGYTHKAIAKHFQHCTFSKGAQLASRNSGDSTVAYAWAYSMAIENLHQCTIPPRAHWLRALLLERERILNHIGDLGALGNDAGLGFGLSQFSRLKEIILRLNAELFGHRYLMDIIVPGGITVNLSTDAITAILQEMQMLSDEVNTLRTIYAEHEGLQDRFVSTGVVQPELAKQLGTLGLTARASDIASDWRVQCPHAPYNKLDVRLHTESSGDVAARVLLRFQEIEESLRLIHIIIQRLPAGALQVSLPNLIAARIGFGCVEGWRGPIFIAICNEDTNHIRWAHLHDPSWQNWPALEHAVLGNIVPDFPLINKSFNLSYSGHDG